MHEKTRKRFSVKDDDASTGTTNPSANLWTACLSLCTVITQQIVIIVALPTIIPPMQHHHHAKNQPQGRSKRSGWSGFGPTNICARGKHTRKINACYSTIVH